MKILEANWDLEDKEKKYAEITCKQLGYNLKEYLNTGYYGSAFKIEDKDGNVKILKITRDTQEADMANRLRKNPVTKHIINCYDVRRINNLDEIDQPYFSIIRDYITLLNYDERNLFDSFPVYTIVATEKNKNISIEDKNKLYKHIENGLDLKREDFWHMYRQIREMSKELKKYNIKGSDLRSENVGWDEDRNLVFFDIGIEDAKPGKRLKPIKTFEQFNKFHSQSL